MKTTGIKDQTLIDFLGAGKEHSRFSSVKDIDAFVAGNRELWADFLNSLPDNPSGGLSREDIQTYINQERTSWDE
jgi:hypothetical protein